MGLLKYAVGTGKVLGLALATYLGIKGLPCVNDALKEIMPLVQIGNENIAPYLSTLAVYGTPLGLVRAADKGLEKLVQKIKH